MLEELLKIFGMEKNELYHELVALEKKKQAELSKKRDSFQVELTSKVKKEDGFLKITFSLPGVDKKDISLSYIDNKLNLSISEDSEYYTGIEKQFNIGTNWDGNKIEAESKNGMLYINIPEKKVSENKNNIEIK